MVSCELSLSLNLVCFCLKKSSSVGWSEVLWANLIEAGWSPDNTCYVCDKFWAVTLKLSQEVGFVCISRFLMDLHQQKWSGKIHILNYWNQRYKVKPCHLLAVLYSKLPWLGRGRCPVCAKTVVLGNLHWHLPKVPFMTQSISVPGKQKLCSYVLQNVCYLYFISQTKFMLKMRWLCEYFIKTLVL